MLRRKIFSILAAFSICSNVNGIATVDAVSPDLPISATITSEEIVEEYEDVFTTTVPPATEGIETEYVKPKTYIDIPSTGTYNVTIRIEKANQGKNSFSYFSTDEYVSGLKCALYETTDEYTLDEIIDGNKATPIKEWISGEEYIVIENLPYAFESTESMATNKHEFILVVSNLSDMNYKFVEKDSHISSSPNKIGSLLLDRPFTYVCLFNPYRFIEKDVECNDGVYNYNTTIYVANPTNSYYTPTAAPTTTVAPATTKAIETTSISSAKGDANCNGKVEISDAVAILQYLANSAKYPLSAQGLINADFDGDGITGADALTIQKMDAAQTVS